MSARYHPHHRRSRDEWQRLLAEHQESKLSQRAFCQQRGLTLSTFNHWKRRLSSSPAALPSKTGDWLELSPDPVQSAGPGWEIELELGNGVCLRLRPC